MLLVKRIEVYLSFKGSQCMRKFSNSVNQDELKKFASLGKEWWNVGSRGGTGPLHAMNPVRVGFIRNQIASLKGQQGIPPFQQLKSLDILDVGCGGGLLSEPLARLGGNITSIDPAPENIAAAIDHASTDPVTSKINYLNTTIEEMVKTGIKYDAVCALEVIEHVENPKAFIESCLRCLKPEGSLFLSTINRTHKSHAVAIVGAEYILGLLPPGTHDWNKFLTPDELIVMIESGSGSGNDNSMIKAKVVAKKGMVLAPKEIKSIFSILNGVIDWKLSDSDLDINYILHAVRYE